MLNGLTLRNLRLLYLLINHENESTKDGPSKDLKTTLSTKIGNCYSVVCDE